VETIRESLAEARDSIDKALEALDELEPEAD
jgi:hypothetical protein